MSLRSRHKHPLIKQGWARAFLLFIVYLLASTMVGVFIGLYAAGNDKIKDVDASYIWISVSSLISVTIVYIFRRYIDRRSLGSIGLKFSEFFPGGIIGFLAGIFLVCTGGLVIHLLGGIQWTDIRFSNDLLISLLMLLLVAVSEELVFRGYILRNLMRSFNQWVALVISSLLFALVHLMNPGIPVVGIVNIVLGGLVLGITFIHTHNLWMPVLFHFSWNFFQGPVLGFPVSGLSFKTLLATSLSGNQLISGGRFGFEGSVVCTVMLSICFLILFFSGRFSRQSPE